MSAAELDRLQSALANAGIAGLVDHYGVPVPDGYQIRLTYEAKTIVVDYGDTPESLMAVIKELTALLDKRSAQTP